MALFFKMCLHNSSASTAKVVKANTITKAIRTVLPVVDPVLFTIVTALVLLKAMGVGTTGAGGTTTTGVVGLTLQVVS